MFAKHSHVTRNLLCVGKYRHCDTTTFVRSSRNHYYPSRMYWGNQAKYLLVQSLIIKWISCNLLSKLSYHAAIIPSTVFHHLKLNAADCRWISCRNIFISRSVMSHSGQRYVLCRCAYIGVERWLSFSSREYAEQAAIYFAIRPPFRDKL